MDIESELLRLRAPATLSANDVAIYCGVTVWLVRYWIRCGVLDVLDVPGEYRTTQAMLSDFLARRREGMAA